MDGSAVMSACTPSRINNEGHPELLNPRNGNYGRGFGRLVRVPGRARAVAGLGRFRRLRSRGPTPLSLGRVVTGGGGGIGAAIAIELGRCGWHVVTVDPLVAVDGTGTSKGTRRPRPPGSWPRAVRPGFPGFGDRRGGRRCSRAEAGRRAGPARRSSQRGRDLPAHLLRARRRGGLAGAARGPHRRLPECPAGGPADHGRRRLGPHFRRHVRVGLASRPMRAATAGPSGRWPR